MPEPQAPTAAATTALTRPGGVAVLASALIAALLAATRAGLLAGLQRALAAQMALRPLPPGYFLVFILLGAALPLALRLWKRHSLQARTVLDPYLLLLAMQILAEGLVTRAGGLGLGVLVGTVFTLLRLLQLTQLWPQSGGVRGLRALVGLLLALWGFNALQMLAFRWLPLLG